MLLDLSGLTREECVMVQSSIDNERDLDRVADALSKDRIKRGDNSNIRWFQEKGKHTASSKPGASAYYANINSVEDYGYDHDTLIKPQRPSRPWK